MLTSQNQSGNVLSICWKHSRKIAVKSSLKIDTIHQEKQSFSEDFLREVLITDLNYRLSLFDIGLFRLSVYS